MSIGTDSRTKRQINKIGREWRCVIPFCYLCGMKTYGDFIYFNEETGRDEFDPYVYSVFFADNIQERLLIPEEEGGGTMTLGLSLEAFADKLESDLESFYKRFYGEIVADKE